MAHEQEVRSIEALTKVTMIAQAVQDKIAQEMVVLDLRSVSSVTDFFIIATGTSKTHLQAIADHVVEALRAQRVKPWHLEGVSDGVWVLLDYGDVVVHLFDPDARAFYDLERLWGDAPRVEIPEASAIERSS